MKHKITARKFEGDDRYSWAIFVDNDRLPVASGLSRREIPYYKKRVTELLEKNKK